MSFATVPSFVVSSFATMSARCVASCLQCVLAHLWLLSTTFWQVGLKDFFFDEVLDFEQMLPVVRGDKGDGLPIAVGTCGSSYSVDVVFWIARYVIVDDHLYVIDVNASTHDVGGNEDADAAVLECKHDFFTLPLDEVAVHCTHIETFTL